MKSSLLPGPQSLEQNMIYLGKQLQLLGWDTPQEHPLSYPMYLCIYQWINGMVAKSLFILAPNRTVRMSVCALVCVVQTQVRMSPLLGTQALNVRGYGGGEKT